MEDAVRDVELTNVVAFTNGREAALRAELERQWAAAHADHCGEYPHEGRCHWPRPEILDQ
jgi:hypothetical protein